jgi:hypothetical protein
MGRKVIARQAEWTDPQIGSKVHLAIGVQDGSATGTTHGIVRECRGGDAGGVETLEGRVQRTKRRHATRGFQAAAGPAVKTHADAQHVF